MTNPIRYFIYIRRSSDENSRRQVLSLNAQLFELRKYAEANKLVVIDVVRESKTAKKPGRKEFNAMLNRVERGMGFPVGILSWHPDRLSRNKVDETRLSILLDSKKLADLKFPTHAFVNNASGKFFLSIQMANAKYYIDQLSENIVRGQREKLRDGAWPGSRPFGFVYDPIRRNIVPHARQAALVAALFREFATGGHSMPGIADWFNHRLRENRVHKTIARNGVERLLRNPLFMGVMRWNGQVFEGRYRPIVKPALWQKAQEVLNSHGRIRPRRARHEFPYRGIFKCSCGAPITAQFGVGKGGTYRYYRCTRRHGPCREPYVREDVVHEQAAAFLSRLKLHESDLAALNKLIEEERSRLQDAFEERLRGLENEMERTNHNLERLVDLHISGTLDEMTFQAKQEQLVSHRLALKGAKTEVESRFPELWFEHALEVVEPLNQAVKITRGSETSEVSTLLRKVCSNPVISQKSLAMKFLPFYDFVAQWRGGMESGGRKRGVNASEAKTACLRLRPVMDVVRTAVDRELRLPRPSNAKALPETEP